MSKILPTNCEDDKISMVMDHMSHPHCVWIEGSTIKYARYYGDGWRFAGNSSVAYSSENELSLSPNCVGVDDNDNCFFVFMDGEDLTMISWNGFSWSSEIVWSNAVAADITTWSVAWARAPVVTAIGSYLWATDKTTGSWSIPSSLSFTTSDELTPTIKSARVSSRVYVFWTGKSDSLKTSWIGHAAWDVDSQQWVYTSSKQIQMSASEGEIIGMDFVVCDEIDSSSSESSGI